MSYRVFSVLLLVALGVSSIVSCGKAEKVEVTDAIKPAAVASPPAEAFIAGMKAYNSQDLTKLLGLFNKDVVWSNMTAVANKLEGRTAMANQLLVERAVFPDCNVGLETVLESGNKLAVLGVFKGTQRGPIHGFAATGREVRYPFLYFIEMNAGQVVHNTAFFNPVIAARQIGAVKTKNVRGASWPSVQPHIARGAAPPEVEGAVRQLLAAMEKGDNAAVAALLADEVTLLDPSLERFEGKEAVAGALVRGSQSFEGLKIPVDQILAAGNFAAVSLVMQGTFSFAGQEPPIRKALDLPGAIFVELKEGRLSSIQLITDEMQPFQQVGIPPKSAFVALGDPEAQESTDSAPSGTEPASTGAAAN